MSDPTPKPKCPACFDTGWISAPVIGPYRKCKFCDRGRALGAKQVRLVLSNNSKPKETPDA